MVKNFTNDKIFISNGVHLRCIQPFEKEFFNRRMSLNLSVYNKSIDEFMNREIASDEI